jgi:hypothetical protein
MDWSGEEKGTLKNIVRTNQERKGRTKKKKMVERV